MTFEKRIRLYREDHPTTDGRILIGTDLIDDSIAVLDAEKNGHVIGMVTDIEFDADTGWVTGILTSDEDVIGLSAQASFDHMNAVFDSDDDDGYTSTFAGARLVNIVLGDSPAWDGMWIF